MEEERRNDEFGMMICNAFQTMLAQEEYRLPHQKAQILYNKICAILQIIPTAIKKIFNK